MTSELKSERIQLLLSPSEVKAIDDWMFAHRYRSRNEAIRQLIGMGLVFEPSEEAYEAASNLILFLIGKLSGIKNEDFKKTFIELDIDPEAHPKVYFDAHARASIKYNRALQARSEYMQRIIDFLNSVDYEALPNLNPDLIDWQAEDASGQD